MKPAANTSGAVLVRIVFCAVLHKRCGRLGHVNREPFDGQMHLAKSIISQIAKGYDQVAA
jgi:hypothetical protein